MKSFNPYLTFDGNCEEALKFYSNCFKGKIEFIQYYDELSAFGIEEMKSKVMHSEFMAEPIHFMACDKTLHQNIHHGTNISMYITFDSLSRQKDVFERLSEKGKIHLALETTVWESVIGILTDKFGIHWMLVYNND